jgi:transcriptional regulator GlxA family with amidase domain
VIGRALDFMHAHAAEPISITDVAAAAFVSTRWLHKAFVERLGEPPVRVLRRIRLNGVRSELLTGAPTTTSVAQVARAWGFVHLSRFAEQYFREYGERPSETLRR